MPLVLHFCRQCLKKSGIQPAVIASKVDLRVGVSPRGYKQKVAYNIDSITFIKASVVSIDVAIVGIVTLRPYTPLYIWSGAYSSTTRKQHQRDPIDASNPGFEASQIGRMKRCGIRHNMLMLGPSPSLEKQNC
ncbi:hypothetical protein V6N11_051871 [Hibiscus sabdariffa]|uniref:Uncharacterized protein n=1 Tax=Hibiscus sabdariffa TaxID=183260 RepID=A0ABR2U8Y2_9ROSI